MLLLLLLHYVSIDIVSYAESMDVTDIGWEGKDGPVSPAFCTRATLMDATGHKPAVHKKRTNSQFLSFNSWEMGFGAFPQHLQILRDETFL